MTTIQFDKLQAYRKKVKEDKKKLNKKGKHKKQKPKQKTAELVGYENKSYKEFLKTKYWKKVRSIVIKRDSYLCVKCGTDKHLQVHHTTYKNHFHEMKHISDLITLCKECHKKEHNIQE